MAFSILGLAHADPAAVGEGAEDMLRALAGRLADLQRANAAPDWCWAEDVLTYDNARLPQALIAAGARLADDDLLAEGLRSLDWYVGRVRHRQSVRAPRGPRVPPSRHPASGPGRRAAADAGALVEAHVEAFLATGSERTAGRAVHAFEWFLGRNRLSTPVYDFATGGCHDGLGEQAVNVNEGAESTLAYLQALLALDAAGLKATAAR